MRKIFILLLPVMLFAAGGELLNFDSNYTNFADGDTIKTDIIIKPPHDSTRAIINGRLGNVNLAADAQIDCSKLDSTTQLIVNNASVDSLTLGDTVINAIRIDTVYARNRVVTNTIRTSSGYQLAFYIDGGSYDNVKIISNTNCTLSVGDEISDHVNVVARTLYPYFNFNGLAVNNENGGEYLSEIAENDAGDSLIFKTEPSEGGTDGYYAVPKRGYDTLIVSRLLIDNSAAQHSVDSIGENASQDSLIIKTGAGRYYAIPAR